MYQSMKTNFQLNFSLYALAGTVLALCIVSTTFAQEAERAVETRGDMNASQRVQMSDSVQARIINLNENIINRTNAAIVRLENIGKRIDSRIEKLKARGVDTAGAEERLAEAKDTLVRARAALGSLGSITDVTSGDSPRTAFASIRAQFVTIQATLRESRIAFVDTINLLKEAVEQAELTRGVSSAVTDTSATDAPSE